MTQLPCEKPALFKGRHFNHLLIIQAVRWYVTYKLSYRDVCDLMEERGVTVVHTTVLRWVQRFVPVFEKMFYERGCQEKILPPTRRSGLFP
jgi:transposase-like protein